MIYNNADLIHYDNRASGLKAGNVQYAIDEIASEAFLFLEVTGSESAGEHATKARIPYPQGFNRDNTFFASGKYQERYSYDSEYDKTYNGIGEVLLGESEIIIPSVILTNYRSSYRFWLIIKKKDLEKFESNV